MLPQAVDEVALLVDLLPQLLDAPSRRLISSSSSPIVGVCCLCHTALLIVCIFPHFQHTSMQQIRALLRFLGTRRAGAV